MASCPRVSAALEESRYNRHGVRCRSGQEQNSDLYFTYVDLTNAVDTVSREGLWRSMGKYGCPTKFIPIFRLLRDEMQAEDQNGGEFSGPFPDSNEVKAVLLHAD